MCEVIKSCQWKPPCKRKETTTLMSEASFEKHVYRREKKDSLKSPKNYDPRPTEYRGSLKDWLPGFLEKICDKA